MTIKSKTFYVSEGGLHSIKNSDSTIYCVPSLNGAYKNEITISWKEDRKAEVTESQIDEIWNQWMRAPTIDGFPNFIKERIFKDVK